MLVCVLVGGFHISRQHVEWKLLASLALSLKLDKPAILFCKNMECHFHFCLIIFCLYPFEIKTAYIWLKRRDWRSCAFCFALSGLIWPCVCLGPGLLRCVFLRCHLTCFFITSGTTKGSMWLCTHHVFLAFSLAYLFRPSICFLYVNFSGTGKLPVV